MIPKKLSPRKLLVAAVGVATLNYVGVACTPPTSGNLPAPTFEPDAGTTPPSNIPPTSGNLDAPPPPADAAPPKIPLPPTAGNLPAPVPRDGGSRL